MVLEGLDILLRQHLKQVLVAQTPSRIAGTGFIFPQNGKTHPGLLQNFHDRLRHLNITIHEGTRASDPKYKLRLWMIGQQWHVEPFSPAGSGGLCAAPRVSTLLHAAQSRFSRFWHATLFEYQVAPHIDDSIDVLDGDRAVFFTGPTGG